MRPGQTLLTRLSTVVQHRVVETARQQGSDDAWYRFHRRLTWVVVLLVLCGLIGSMGPASAGPAIVESEDTGGSGGSVVVVERGGGIIEQVDGAPLGPQLTANEQTAVRLFDEVFSQRTPDVCVLLMAGNAVNHTPAGDFRGPAGFEQYVAGVWTEYPDASFAFNDGVTDGDLVTVHWTLSGAQAGGAGQLKGTAILRFERNMIAESWIQYDSAAPAEQIIVTPAAPEICPPCREP